MKKPSNFNHFRGFERDKTIWLRKAGILMREITSIIGRNTSTVRVWNVWTTEQINYVVEVLVLPEKLQFIGQWQRNVCITIALSTISVS